MRCALDLLQPLERPAVLERKGFIDAAGDLPDGLGDRLAGPAGERTGSSPAIWPPAKKVLSSVSMIGAEGLGPLRFLDDVVPAELLPGLLPVSPALLDEPQAHDVA